MGDMNAPTPPSPSAGLQAGQAVAGQQQAINTQTAGQQQGINTQTANQQQGLNVNTGFTNQASNTGGSANPFGSLDYTQVGTGPNGVPIYRSNVNYSPENQQLINTLMGTKGTAGSAAGGLLSNANYGGSTPQSAIGDLTGGLTNQIMGQETSYLNPFFKTQKDQEDTALRNQGLLPGEAGYDNAMRGVTTGQDLTVSNFEAQTMPQIMAQATNEYQLPMNMSESLGNFGGPVNPTSQFASDPGTNINPATVNQTTIQPANLIGATANEQSALEQQYKNQMDQYSGMMNGLFGIGADALGVIGAPFTGGASLALLGAGGGLGSMFGGGGGGQTYGLNAANDPYAVANSSGGYNF